MDLFRDRSNAGTSGIRTGNGTVSNGLAFAVGFACQIALYHSSPSAVKLKTIRVARSPVKN